MGNTRSIGRLRRRRTLRLLAGGPPSERDMGLMEQAGFDLDDEADVVLGALTMAAARLVAQRAWPEMGVAEKKPGRNEPCPCGSGRKFKACCMRTETAPSPSERVAERDERLLSVVPNLKPAEDAPIPELEIFADLLMEDSDLSEIRLPPELIEAYWALEDEVLDAEGAEGAEEFDEDAFDALTERFLTENEVGFPPGTTDTLLGVVPGYDDDTDALRALAFAVLHAEMHNSGAFPGLNVVLDAILRVSLRESEGAGDAEFEERGRRVAERILDGRDGRALLAELCDDIEAFFDGEASVEEEEPDGTLYERLSDLILAGVFPVRGHTVSAFPLLVATASEDEEPEGFPEEILAAADSLLPEDTKLYFALMDCWLEEYGDEDELLSRSVRVVRRLLEKEAAPGVLMMAQMAWTFHGPSNSLPGEDEFMETREPGTLFENFAAFMDELGYPTLAERTRTLQTEIEDEG